MATYQAAKALIEYEGTYLIIEQDVNGIPFNDIPGGRLEGNEDILEALHREVKEEVGLDISIVRKLGDWSFERIKDKDIVVCATFLCTSASSEVDFSQNTDPGEIITKHLWLTKEELLQLDCNPGLKKMFEMI